ncbi:MAG TPA: hypothetical protein DEP35_05010 [Deltaproteobacteria bacterium]|nr:hypothetical protein [Deltaproteobacteria bacterium]
MGAGFRRPGGNLESLRVCLLVRFRDSEPLEVGEAAPARLFEAFALVYDNPLGWVSGRIS